MTLRELSIECLACSSELRFVPAQFSTRCHVCEDSRPLPLRFTRDIPDTLIDTLVGEHAGTPDPLQSRTRFRCTSAGCGVLLSAAAALPACPCCGGELVDDPSEQPVLEAHAQLGFLIFENKARALIHEELARLGLLAQLARLERVYLPTAVMSCEFHVRYTGEHGRSQSDGNGNSSTVWTPVSGEVERPMQNLRGSAAASPAPEQIQRLDPWDYAFAVPYAAAQLDAPAVHVASTPAELFTATLPKVHEELHSEVCYAIGGDRQRVHSMDTSMSERRVRLVLLPVWIAALHPGNTLVLVNGRTGEVAVAGHANEDELPPERPWYLRIWSQLFS